MGKEIYQRETSSDSIAYYHTDGQWWSIWWVLDNGRNLVTRALLVTDTLVKKKVLKLVSFSLSFHLPAL